MIIYSQAALNISPTILRMTVPTSVYIKCIIFAVLNALIWYRLNKILNINTITDEDKSAHILSFIGILRNISRSIKNESNTSINTSKIIFEFIAYIFLLTILLPYMQAYTVYSIYKASLINNTNRLQSKYNIATKSFMVSSTFKNTVIAASYYRYLVITMLIEICIMMFLIEDMYARAMLIGLYIILVLNMKYGFISNLYIFATLAITLAGMMQKTQILFAVAYLIYNYAGYASYRENTQIPLTLKKFGIEIPNNWSKIIVNSKMYNYQEKNKQYVFNRGELYKINSEPNNPVDHFLYEIANLYYHDKEFFVEEYDQKYKYSSLSPQFWRNIILLDEAFDEYDRNKSIIQNIEVMSGATQIYIYDIYKQMNFNLLLENKISWADLTRTQKVEIMALMSICSSSSIILLADFISNTLNEMQINVIRNLCNEHNKLCVMAF